MNQENEIFIFFNEHDARSIFAIFPTFALNDNGMPSIITDSFQLPPSFSPSPLSQEAFTDGTQVFPPSQDHVATNSPTAKE